MPSEKPDPPRTPGDGSIGRGARSRPSRPGPPRPRASGDREPATLEAIALRRLFYPRSIGLGLTVERVDGTGTPAEVIARLGSATVIHFGCAVRLTGLPALALVAVQRWMCDPHRAVPAIPPPGHRNTVAGTDLTDPALWGALCYHGR